MSDGASRNSVRSWPTQKPRPAPVTMTARTSSARACLRASRNPSCIARLNAFRTSGRLSVMVRTAPSRLTSTSDMDPLLPLWIDRRNLGRIPATIRLRWWVARGRPRRRAGGGRYVWSVTELTFVDALLGPGRPDSAPDADAADDDDDEALDAYSRVVSTVARRLTSSVANLRVRRRSRSGRRLDGGGSGVVVTPDGYMLTSAHVVASATRDVWASFADGREVRSQIVGADPLSDLALLRADDHDLAAAELGDAERLRVGQLVVAIGNPHGFASSVTAGGVPAPPAIP